MVCVPCIFLPILLAIYLKFIQPFVLRILPEKWVTFLDPYLYPTCPAKPPPSAANENETGISQHSRNRAADTLARTRSRGNLGDDEDAAAACCEGKAAATESKKDL